MGTAPEAEAGRHLRHNVLALGADLGLFMVGLSFASQSTLLPAFMAHLGAPNLAIGAIDSVMTVGWFLPALFVASHTETLARKLPFVLRWTVSNFAVDMAAAGNLKPSRASARDKIDPIVAAIMALDRAMRHENRRAALLGSA